MNLLKKYFNFDLNTQKNHKIMTVAYAVAIIFAFVVSLSNNNDVSASVSRNDISRQLAEEAALTADISEDISESSPVYSDNSISNIRNLFEKVISESVEKIVEQEIIVQKGDSFISILGDLGLGYNESYQLSQVLKKVYNPSNLRIGQKIAVTTKVNSHKHELLSIENITIEPKIGLRYILTKNEKAQYVALEIKDELMDEINSASGVINGTVSTALRAQGVPAAVVNDFVKIFAYSVDFRREVRKGDRFRFEINWKLYPKSGNRLRDVWRDYSDHLRTSNPELAKYIPLRSVEERTFYPGLFGSHTYFVKEREDRLRPGTNVWFYSWHDNISERYPVAGEWWSAGNNWREKLTPLKLKTYMDTLQKEKKFNLILYLRQLANLKQRGKEFPDGWYRRTPGGALHLYGGGYEVKLPQRVAKEVGYDRIPLGQYDFSNPEYRDFYHKEIFKAIRYYKPRAIGWDMGSDLNEFLTIARTYETIRKEKLPVKVVANESAGPTQLYSDMVLLENGLLGGKSSYDFEIARAYTTAVVCLERFNLFNYAVAANLDGKRTWLTEYGLAENKRYLDALLKRRPELRQDRTALSRLCQLRASIYDLSLGASPGYLEEAQPAPESLMQMAADVNGLFGVNQSFVLKLPNGLDTDGRLSVSAWQNAKQFRLAAYNDDAQGRQLKLRLDRKFFQEKGWDLKTIAGGKHLAVTPEGESPVEVRFRETSTEIVLETELPAFGALLVFADR